PPLSTLFPYTTLFRSDIARDQLEDVVGRVLEPTRLRVRLHPDDLASAGAVVPDLTRRLGESVHAEIIESPDIGRGSVVVLTERGDRKSTRLNSSHVKI